MNWIYSSSINPRERGFETIKIRRQQLSA